MKKTSIITVFFIVVCLYFYTQQINTQGILTFNNGLNGFANVPLPLEYAAIAPFYSNVDTSNAGPNSLISLSIMDSDVNFRKAYNVIQRNFDLKNDFHVSNVIIATWLNVGHYQMNNTAQNTFQVFQFVKERLMYFLDVIVRCVFHTHPEGGNHQQRTRYICTILIS